MKAAIAQGLGRFSPTLRLGAAAFWVAWICILYSGDCIVVPSTNPSLTTNNTFMLSTMAVCLTFFSGGIASKPVERLLRNTGALVGAGVLAAAFTAGIAFEGALPEWLFLLCAACSGVPTGLLALKSATLYAEYDTQRIVIASSLSIVVGTLLYAFASLCALYFTPVAVLAFTAPLPLLGMLLSLVPGPDDMPAEDDASRTLTPAFLRVVVFCGVLVFALSCTRGYYPQGMPTQEFAQSRGTVAVGLLATSTAIALAAAALPREGRHGTFLYVMLLAPMATILPIAALGPQSPVSGALGGVANGVVNSAAWCLFAVLSFKSGMSAVRVMGFGFGAVSLGMVLGFMAGYFFGSVIAAEYALAGGIALFAACVVIAAAMVHRGDLEQAALPSPHMRATAEEDIDESHGLPQASTEADKDTAAAATGQAAAQVGAAANAPGKFVQKCLVIAHEHNLSERETDVFMLLAKRWEAKAIADELFISFNTTRTHISHVYAKLGVHSRRELFDLIDSYRI